MSATLSRPSLPSPTGNLGERLRVPLMLLGVAAVLIAALTFWLTGGRYMSTDDAYVQAARTSISSNIAGQVARILVHDNEPVHRGQLLFTVDDQPYRIAVEAAQAKLASARLTVLAGKATYRQQLASVRSAQDTVSYQEKEYDRQRKLLATGIASQAMYDGAQHALDNARQQEASAQQQAAGVLAMLDGDADIDVNRHPSVLQAQAELDRAKLNLSYTQITAPDDGIVTKVEQLQVGDHINAASPVFALISTRDVWIEANFKESQLAHMRAGQLATIQIDTYPGRTFKARVASIAPGTGSQFSVLPPENATGNWVKVVQRLPVRLELDDAVPDLPLHSGLSASVDVDTGHRRGLRSLF
jgi:membrane fusion protein, multidrug efflux system